MFKTVTIPVSELLSVSAELCCPWETAAIISISNFQILNERALLWRTKIGVYSSDVITMVSRRILMSHPRTPPENISSDFDQPKKQG